MANCGNCLTELPEDAEDAICDTCRLEESKGDLDRYPLNIRENFEQVLRMEGCNRPVIVADQFMEMIADCLEDLDVPIDIEHWMKTKRELSRQTGLAVAKWFRDQVKNQD